MTTQSDLKKRIRARQAKTGEAYTTAREHVVRTGNTVAPTVTAVVLKCNETSVRLRVHPGGDSITFRCSGYDALCIAPAQLVEIAISKRWTWRGDAYASGDIVRAWTDVAALQLKPLNLDDRGVDDISGQSEGFEAPDPYAKMWAFFASTPRQSFEFDGIAWGVGVGTDPDDPEACSIADAVEFVHSDENRADENRADENRADENRARELLMEALLDDPRCIDAHVHLGDLIFDDLPHRAIVHYEIALAIGEQSLGREFTAMLPWGHLYNRPFLRALHGYALCLWRAGKMAETQAALERLLSLNPNDNQGARFCWNEVRRGLPWAQLEGMQGSSDNGLPA